jgi:hypothetical protein
VGPSVPPHPHAQLTGGCGVGHQFGPGFSNYHFWRRNTGIDFLPDHHGGRRRAADKDVRPAVLASIRQSNRFMSRDYNSEANVPAAYVGQIEGMQVLSVHESLWPKTNITLGTGTANDTDSNYLVDARFASTAGAPGLFIVAVGNETGPVAESSAPNRQGLEIRPYLDDESDTLFIQTRQRYCMRRFVPSRSGVLWFKG